MDTKLREQADDLLRRSLEETGAPDPRDAFRPLLRELKDRDKEAYLEAVAKFQETVVPAIAEGSVDPLTAWLQYGIELAQRLDPGREVVIDATGRATPLAPPPSWRDLILHVPEASRARTLLIGYPAEPTSAQRATVDLLVRGKVRLDA